jgi:hypothetical protein
LAVSRGQQLAYADADARSSAGRVLGVEAVDAQTVGRINKRIRIELAQA